MKRSDAKIIAESVTNEQLKEMLNNAKIQVKDWTKASKANKGLDRGVIWNMFCKDFDESKNYSAIIKFRMIQEFGEFLSADLIPKKQVREFPEPAHQTPQF